VEKGTWYRAQGARISDYTNKKSIAFASAINKI
jgi:hypothetical protein